MLPLFATGSFGSVITDPPYGVGIADWDIPPDSAILAECLRVATGTVVMFGGAPIVSLAHFLSLDPSPERMLIWAPQFTMVHVGKNGMREMYDPLFCWRLPKHQGLLPFDVIGRSTPHKTFTFDHPCKKPDSLIADLIRAFGGTSVLDPYLGSGTTLAACAKLGIPGTGIEISEEYCEMAAARLSEDLSYGPANLFTLRPAAEVPA